VSPDERLPPTPREPRLSRAALIVGLYGALAVAALIWATVDGRNPFTFPGVEPRPERMVVGIALGLALGLAVVAGSRWSVKRFDWAKVLHGEFHALVHDLSAREILLLAAASSIGEELFFRGALLPAVGLLPSTLIFAALHFRPHRRFLPWTAMSFIVGLVLGLLFRELGDLAAPLTAHFVINFFNLRHIAKHEQVA
jgi:membrane protease YdiL (CAAX protease family)